jgi:hypothetical protein
MFFLGEKEERILAQQNLDATSVQNRETRLK